MKVAKSGRRKSAAKGRGAPKTVDAYLAGVPEPSQGALRQLRAAIRSVAPKAATETISYGIPAIRYKEILVWYAAFTKHCSLFPTASVIAKFKTELKSFSTSKGTIKFPLDKPLPIALIKKLVKARLAEIEKKKPV